MQLTKGGRKNNGPELSAGQWPSQDCKAVQKWTALLNVIVAFSDVISSPSSILTGGIVCLKFFSLKYCNHFNNSYVISQKNSQGIKTSTYICVNNSITYEYHRISFHKIKNQNNFYKFGHYIILEFQFDEQRSIISFN